MENKTDVQGGNYFNDEKLTTPEETKKELSPLQERVRQTKKDKIVHLMVDQGRTPREAVKLAKTTMGFFYKMLEEDKKFEQDIIHASEFLSSIADLNIHKKMRREHEGIQYDGDIKTTMWYAERRMPEYSKKQPPRTKQAKHYLIF